MKLSSTIKRTLSKGRAWVVISLIGSMGAGMMTTSCEDMLTPDSERHAYEVAKDTLYSYWGILKSLQNIADRYIILNECRGDLVNSTNYVSDTISAILNFGQNGYQDKYKDEACAYFKASDYYHVINSCNAYIAMCDTDRMTGLNEKYMIQEYAQVEAIRAWVYMQLVLAYGEVPFYLEPILNTDDINAFISDPKHKTVNADNLVDELAPRLINMEYVERRYGYPAYETYTVCHSTKCMFPVSLVLGDLYLMKGDKASCAEAAQHYYNYLNYRYGGPLSNTSYYCTGNIMEGEDEPLYGWEGVMLSSGSYSVSTDMPWLDIEKVSNLTEAITAIPSNEGKLDGRVLTDINRLFGFEPTLYASGSGTSSSSSVGLTLNIERELVGSKAYEDLCKAQDYEVYIGTPDFPQGQAFDEDGDPISDIEVLPGVGDARQYWDNQYTVRVGEDWLYGRFVTKFNPGAIFTPVAHMVYRKATIWLRFAEAINRAGFPSYAFAVLQKGLCNNDEWYPSTETDYAPKDYLMEYVIDGNVIASDTILSRFQSKLEAKLASGELDTVLIDSVRTSVWSTYNYPDKATPAVCYFLDKREVQKAQATPYMYFNTQYLRSSNRESRFNWKMDIFERGMHSSSIVTSNTESYLTAGIHQRGCGRLAYNETASRFDYVKKVIEKVKENTGKTITKEEIYDGSHDADVQDAVEDVIIDEMGLELAFEGTRFFDLSRVARRRNDPTYLAKRVAARSGVTDMTLYNYLSQSEKNWYLPLPEK